MTKKLISCLLIFLCLCTCLAPFNVIWADEQSASINFNTSSVDVGSQVIVTLRFSNTTANISRVECNLTYNETVVEVISQSGGYISEIAATPTDNLTVTLTFRTLAEGNSTFTIENCRLWDENDNLIGTATANNTLSVKDTSSLLSSNANLKSLTVPYGTLEPAFSPEITEYTVTVDYSVTKFPVSALPEEDKASASITENQSLAVGENTRIITVTAPDGTQKKYTITIMRAEPEATPTPTQTQNAGTNQTQRPTNPPDQTQIQWGTPAQDITDAPDAAVTAEATPTPAVTVAPTPSASANTGMSVNDLKNAMLTVIVIAAIIIIVVLFTIVYCMQQKDKKKHGNSKGKRK